MVNIGKNVGKHTIHGSYGYSTSTEASCLNVTRDSCPFWRNSLKLCPQGCFAQNLASEASKTEPHGDEGC